MRFKTIVGLLMVSVFGFFISPVPLSARDNIKFAFLAPDTLNPANAAIFNGASDALRELEARFGKKFELEYISARGSSEVQVKQLGALYVGDFSGALVAPVYGGESMVSKKAAELLESGFYCVEVGSETSGGGYFASVSTDRKKFTEAIRAEMQRLSGKNSPLLMCYMWSASPAESLKGASKGELDRLLYPSLNASSYAEIVSGYKIAKAEKLEYYSIYARENAIEIKRMDNYAEIFFNPMLLANLSPIERDTDRVFSLCVGALPQLDFYLSGGMLDSCVFDDYYGWGYFSARALAEKTISGIDPTERQRRLNPLVATPQNVEKFRRDWKLWLK